MSVFMGVIGITGGVVYGVLKLKDSSPFLVCEFSAVEHFVVLVHGVCKFPDDFSVICGKKNS